MSHYSTDNFFWCLHVIAISVQPSVSNIVSTEGDSEVEVCIELASENLQRSVTVNVKTVSSPTSTGKHYT